MLNIPPPLAFLRSSDPPRTTTKHQNPILLQDTHDRQFSIGFGSPDKSSPAMYGYQTFAPKQANLEPSFYMPPPHYHLLQDEHFHVHSGEGIWHLWGGRTVRLSKGDDIMVPAGKWHTFDVAPESEEPLTVSYKYDAEYPEMEDRFFRNVMSYFADCRRAGRKPSVFQLMVFSMHNWMPIGLPVPGPERFNFVVNTILMVVMGCIGQFLLGYKASYSEYYDEGDDARGKEE